MDNGTSNTTCKHQLACVKLYFVVYARDCGCARGFPHFSRSLCAAGLAAPVHVKKRVLPLHMSAATADTAQE